MTEQNIMMFLESSVNKQELNIKEKGVLLTLVVTLKQGLQPTMEELAEITDIKRRQLFNHIDQLEKKGYIKKTRVGRVNKFEVLL